MPASKPRNSASNIRFVVTSLIPGSPVWLYDSFYWARGQAENLIKLHKTQLSSDRTSCRSTPFPSRAIFTPKAALFASRPGALVPLGP